MSTIGPLRANISPKRQRGNRRAFSRWRFGLVCGNRPIRVFAACLLVFSVDSTLGDEEKVRLVDEPTHDQVVLDEANHNAVLKVVPLDLPGRRKPAKPEGNLPVRLIEDPTQQFEVPLENITDVRFFEDLLLAEAQRLTAKEDFDGAFPYYARLLREFPSKTGVNDAANDFLRRNSLAFYQAGEVDRALSVLAALYERSPKSPGLATAVDTVCGRMIEQELQKRNYASARGVLEMWQNEFSALKSQAATAWEQKFSTAAQRQVVEAKQLIAQRKYVAARKAIGRARDIWPDHPEASALLSDIQRQNPTVSVGVIEASPRQAARRIDDWASLRASRLLEPTLAEIVDFNSEGGVYGSPYGEWIADESGLRLSLKLTSPGGASGNSPSADYLARLLLSMADPLAAEYRPELAALLAGVSVEGADAVHLDLLRAHVRPEALLQVPVMQLLRVGEPSTAPRRVIGPRAALTDSEPGSVAFNLLSDAGRQRPRLRTIVEQTFPNDDAAVSALLHGEVDVLDRVPPWQVERLRAAKDIRVDSYRLPTVHVLVPNPAKPLPAIREFRRALCFGIHREQLVKQIMLGGKEMLGFQVLSGPFPAGTSFSDPLRYAYNNQIEPRAYEPRLATVLATVAWSRVLDPEGKGNIELTELPRIVLAHPADPVARINCETIKVQLGRAGIPVDLQEFPADAQLAGDVDYDLRYAELAVWEPVADARALLGASSQVGELASPYMQAALRELDEATNWKGVRSKLAEIHEIASHDLPLIPLWQTVNYFAYRTAIQGIGESPISLYQNVDQWQIAEDARTAKKR